MEKQVVIKHPCDKIESIINDLIRYLEVMSDFSEPFNCSFQLHKNDYRLLDDIKNLKTLKIEKKHITKPVEYIDIEISILYVEVKKLLHVIIMYDLNAVISYEKVKLFLNDNDGDFIVVSHDSAYYDKIKKLQRNNNRLRLW